MNKLIKLTSLLLLGTLVSCGTDNNINPKNLTRDETIEMLDDFNKKKTDKEIKAPKTMNATITSEVSMMGIATSEYEINYVADFNTKRIYQKEVTSTTSSIISSSSSNSEKWVYVDGDKLYTVSSIDGVKQYKSEDASLFDERYKPSFNFYLAEPASTAENLIGSGTAETGLIEVLNNLSSSGDVEEEYVVAGEGNLSGHAKAEQVVDMSVLGGGTIIMTSITNFEFNNYLLCSLLEETESSVMPVKASVEIEYLLKNITLPNLSQYQLVN
ncbi:MAG: hypothetical protein LBM03_00315 [Erysipelotrichaceae bacterium]|nr:hypothetical protein [Erysipelotrichaceae bacterium]